MVAGPQVPEWVVVAEIYAAAAASDVAAERRARAKCLTVKGYCLLIWRLVRFLNSPDRV